MSIKVYLMAILDNYMFRPLLAIFRLSSRELKVLLYTMCTHVVQISQLRGRKKKTPLHKTSATRTFKLDASHQTIEPLVTAYHHIYHIWKLHYTIRPVCRDLCTTCALNVYSRTLSSLEDNLKMASKGRNM